MSRTAARPFLRSVSSLALLAGLLAVPAVVRAEEAVNTDKTGVAIQGYDPVAYFTDGKPEKGNFMISSTHEGATYWFASKEHKELFDKDPHKYVPCYGGFCAFGVAINKKFSGDPLVWKIVDGKLYLNLSPEIAKKWNEDVSGNLKKSDANWPGIKDKTVAEANK